MDSCREGQLSEKIRTHKWWGVLLPNALNTPAAEEAP